MRERLEAQATEIGTLRERIDGLDATIDGLRRAPQSSGQYREAVEMAERGSARVAHAFGASCSSSSLVKVAKNVSATALSKHEPTAPIDCAMPASWQVWPKVRPMYWPPWSE